jgi:hypothetical protein
MGVVVLYKNTSEGLSANNGRYESRMMNAWVSSRCLVVERWSGKTHQDHPQQLENVLSTYPCVIKMKAC